MRLLAVLGVAAVAAPGAGATVWIPGAASPSGNVRCVYAGEIHRDTSAALFCTVTGAHYASALRAYCAARGLPWRGFILRSVGPGKIYCAPRGAYHGTPRYRPLRGDDRYRASDWICHAVPTGGLGCNNGRGHLFVSQSRWRGW